MRNSLKLRATRAIAAALAGLICVAAAHAGERDDPTVQKTLRAMANADTDWHPDLAGEFNGMRYYAHGKFHDAMEQFLAGAYYGDKLSQLSVGLMYLNGEGVVKDPVTAYAWLDLAAERGYANFVMTRDSIKAKLSAEQLQQAQTVRESLDKTYADAVAKPRLAVQLRLGQMQLTGSRLGYDSGVLSALPGDAADKMGGLSRCAGPTILLGYENAPITGCGGEALYARTFWVPEKYFASRDAVWKSEVIIGSMTQQGKSDAGSANKPPL